jgi:TIGR03009 family protein
MRLYRRVSMASVAGMGMIAVAFGQTAPAQPGRVPGRPKAVLSEPARRQQLESLLEQWEGQSSTHKSLHVTMTRLDSLATWEEKVKFEGTAYFQSPDLASVEFQKVDGSKRPSQLIPHEKVICAKDHILQYVYPTQQIYVYPLAREERKRALEEGPLPFLFNTQAKTIQERYELSIIDQNQRTYLIEIKPRLAADKETFVRAYLWLDKESFFPRKLLMHLPNNNGKDTKQYTFTGVKWDERLKPEIFQGRMIAGWKVVRNPDK